MMSFDRNYKDSRILVTGGAGFIGSHLSERLLAAGAEVVCADNYFTGSSKNIAHLRSNLIFNPLPQDDPLQRQPDLSKAKALLNWEPKVALADGLKTIAYFRRSLELS
jgi:nucleoside-diphosphate-sugar epimerase